MPDKVGYPYRPKRSLGAYGERVDEDAVAWRYTRNSWSIPQCASAFRIGTRRVRRILDERGVELRGNKQELDPGAVVRAYAHFGNCGAVAWLLGVSEGRITQVLDEKGIRHDSARRVAPTVRTQPGYRDLPARAASRSGQVTAVGAQTGFCPMTTGAVSVVPPHGTTAHPRARSPDPAR